MTLIITIITGVMLLAAKKKLSQVNKIGAVVFLATRFIQRLGFARKGVVRMVVAEQRKAGENRRMSTVLWDTFTGSASYRDILMRTIHPVFLGRLLWNMASGLMPFRRRNE